MARIIPVEINEMDVITIAGIKGEYQDLPMYW